MTTSLDLRLERVLDATPEQAWAAWFDAAARLVWFDDIAGAAVDAATDLRVGGAWHVAFGDYREEGVFLEFEPPSRALYTCVFSGPGTRFETTVTVTFEARDGKTAFTLLDAGFPDEATLRAHSGGWPSFLDRYEGVLADRASR